MRVSNDRYSCDLRSFNLAIRMLSHEARTHTICMWTGLSAERVRNLSTLHRREGLHKGVRRHRGPSPTKLAGLLTSPSLRSEAAALAGVCRILKVIPEEPLANARTALPNVGRGERLCSALELFRGIVPHARLSLDQLVMLVVSLADAAEWSIDRCSRCSALVVVDRLGLARALCEDCQHDAHTKRVLAFKTGESRVQAPTELAKGDETSEAIQLGLFDSKDTENSR
jgi:hypothetical protein